MSKGQEGSKTQEQEFSNEFVRISDEKVLRQYEEKNRDRLIEAEAETRIAFDNTWKKLTGKPYFQPVTAQRVVNAAQGKNNTEAGDPKSCNYREVRPFSHISWNKQRQKIGKRMQPRWTFYGVDAETGSERQIYVNLSEDRVLDIFGAKLGKDITTHKDNTGEQTVDVDLEVEGFWQVLFTPKQDPNDTHDVHLHHEGRVLVIERMKPVILPGFYIEAADNATRPQYIQTPQESRKIIGAVQMYPYTVQRKATYEEFVEMKAEGDRITREKRKMQEEA